MTDRDPRRAFTPTERDALRLVAGNLCSNCGLLLDRSFHADHVHPHSAGGRTDLTNAEALCPSCNLSKGTKTMLGKTSSLAAPNTLAPIDLRSWQEEALETTMAAARNGDPAFLVHATPGAGKTRFASELIAALYREGIADLAIFVCPSTTIRDQMVSSTLADSGLYLDTVLDGISFRRVLAGGVGFTTSGFAMTYKTLVANWTVVEALCARHKVVFIADEVHHASEEKVWGDRAVQATANATFRVGLSGTPFRSDSQRIAFMDYSVGSEGLTGIASYSFTYREALTAGYVAPVRFWFQNARIGMRDRAQNEALIEVTLDQVLPSTLPLDALRLRTAYDPLSGYSNDVIRRAHAHLVEQRKTDPNAGGLVIAHSIEAAEAAAKFIRRELCVGAVLVHSKETAAAKDIARFRDSKDVWLVSVAMVSEGVDIPRLRTLAYLTVTQTQMAFHQAIGRIVRVDQTRDVWDQVGDVFLPPIPFFTAQARAFEADMVHVLRERKLEADPRVAPAKPMSAEDGEPLPRYSLENLERFDDGVIGSGLHLTEEALQEARASVERGDFSFLTNFPKEQVTMVVAMVIGATDKAQKSD